MIPKVSVIVPVYNAEDYLSQCVDSILNQQLEEIEVILIDDGSIDNSPKICDQYMMHDNRIKVLHIENQGVSNARNKGLEMSVGEYIAFVDADDWVDKNIYFNMVNLITDANADIGICSHFTFDGTHESISELPWENGTVLEGKRIAEDLIPSFISPIGINEKRQPMIMGTVWKCIFKRQILIDNQIIFDRQMKYTEDLIFVLNAVAKSKRIILSNTPFYHHRRDKQIKSATTQRYVDGVYSNLKLSREYIHKILVETNNFEKLYKSLEARNCLNLLWSIYNICAKNNTFSFKEKVTTAKYFIKDSNFNMSIDLVGYSSFRFYEKILLILARYHLISFVIIIYVLRNKIDNIKL